MPSATSPASRNSVVPLEPVERDTIPRSLKRLDAFARYEVPNKVALIPEELTVESGALTPTLKVKRRVVEERYRGEIEALYAGGGAPGDAADGTGGGE